MAAVVDPDRGAHAKRIYWPKIWKAAKNNYNKGCLKLSLFIIFCNALRHAPGRSARNTIDFQVRRSYQRKRCDLGAIDRQIHWLANTEHGRHMTTTTKDA